MYTFHFGSAQSLGLILIGLVLLGSAFVPSTRRVYGQAAQQAQWKRLGAAALGIAMMGAAFMPSSGFLRLRVARTVVGLEYGTSRHDVTLRLADITAVQWETVTSNRRNWRGKNESRRLVIKTVHGRTYRSTRVTPEAAGGMQHDIDRLVAAPAAALQPVYELPLRPPRTPPDSVVQP
ncbi:hypothetical protein [Longimicrobium sp.]|jgi:hypothetical protein|uniref:hypothetical protein n=1 Tax=Longimicrobium sp. TaxID=2029185 RepID=UPI002ED84CD0